MELSYTQACCEASRCRNLRARNGSGNRSFESSAALRLSSFKQFKRLCLLTNRIGLGSYVSGCSFDGFSPPSCRRYGAKDSVFELALHYPPSSSSRGSGRGLRLQNASSVSCLAAACSTSSGRGEGTEEARSVVNSLRSIAALRSLPAVALGLGVLLSLPPSRAWACEASKASLPDGKGLVASAWAGLVAGGLHTLTGPDHLAALAPLIIGRSKVQSAAVGALWGCGHDAGQIIFGLAFLLLKDKLHIELIRVWASRIVGLTLITIGAVGIYESSEPIALPAEGVAVQDGVREPEVRIRNDSKHATTFATGVVYGLQPDALLVILPALALPSRISGAAFLGMFLLGTVLAMGSYTLFLSTFSLALQKRLPGITKILSLGSSVIAIALGLALVVSELFGVVLF